MTSSSSLQSLGSFLELLAPSSGDGEMVEETSKQEDNHEVVMRYIVDPHGNVVSASPQEEVHRRESAHEAYLKSVGSSRTSADFLPQQTYGDPPGTITSGSLPISLLPTDLPPLKIRTQGPGDDRVTIEDVKDSIDKVHKLLAKFTPEEKANQDIDEFIRDAPRFEIPIPPPLDKYEPRSFEQVIDRLGEIIFDLRIHNDTSEEDEHSYVRDQVWETIKTLESGYLRLGYLAGRYDPDDAIGDTPALRAAAYGNPGRTAKDPSAY